MTISRGRLGSGRLGAADYAPPIIRRDFYAPGLLGAETFRRQRQNFVFIFLNFFKKIFFQKKKFFSKKFFFKKKIFISQKQVFFQKQVFSQKTFFSSKKRFSQKNFFLLNGSLFPY